MRREIGIYVSGPLVSDKRTGQSIYPITYTHTIDAMAGYRSCTFTFGVGRDEMNDWLQHGVGRHVEVYDDALSPCWQGFVSKVSPVYGALNLQVGPLLDAANRVALQYSGVDMSLDPPAVGVQVTTGWADDADSQEINGNIPELLSTGAINALDADDIRNTYLAENVYPPVRQDWTSRGRSKSALRVDCLGYYAWLMYPYNQTVNVGTLTTDEKILAILAANLNIGWLPFDTSRIEAPASPVNVPRYEYENVLAWDQITDIVAMGDANSDRWLFGVYDDLSARYWQAPTELSYFLALNDPVQRIVSSSGQEMEYADVRPGNWLLFCNFLVGNSLRSDLPRDPRSMFIESVTYTLPRTLALKGGRFDTLSQTLGRLGVGSLG